MVTPSFTSETYDQVGAYTFTVPETSICFIVAYGARGGSGEYGPTGVGGLGADVGGDFYLARGDQITVDVGGQGGPESYYSVAADGGGSFVVDGTTGAILTIAGGSGGANYNSNGGEGLVTTSGGAGDGPGAGAGGENGQDGGT